MKIGTVTGSVWSSRKVACLAGQTFLVVSTLEGDLVAVACAGNQEESGCSGADLCVTRYVWQRINESITQAVDTMWLDQLVEESRKLRDKGQICAQACEN